MAGAFEIKLEHRLPDDIMNCFHPRSPGALFRAGEVVVGRGEVE
jgi:hypothetical protein